MECIEVYEIVCSSFKFIPNEHRIRHQYLDLFFKVSYGKLRFQKNMHTLCFVHTEYNILIERGEKDTKYSLLVFVSVVLEQQKIMSAKSLTE